MLFFFFLVQTSEAFIKRRESSLMEGHQNVAGQGLMCVPPPDGWPVFSHASILGHRVVLPPKQNLLVAVSGGTGSWLSAFLTHDLTSSDAALMRH